MSLNKIGDIRFAGGDRAGALKVYEESLEIRRRLAAGDDHGASGSELDDSAGDVPARDVPERDVLVSLSKVGDVRLAGGDRAGALKAYEESLEIARWLAAGDPGHAGLARDVSVALDRIGDVRAAGGDRDGALKAYEESLAVRRRLAAGDPGNARWARDLSVSLDRVGDGRSAAGDRAGARAAYTQSLEIRKRLAADDPGNADLARDRIVSNVKLAHLATTASMALPYYATALAIAEDLARSGRLAPPTPG
ncbi:MAG: tetratricopeptide repeat protein [Defluviicoccus sp.]|nr:MAG: tetratricopeptide repeat protein [Defluviicoccus sp.]